MGSASNPVDGLSREAFKRDWLWQHDSFPHSVVEDSEVQQKLVSINRGFAEPQALVSNCDDHV